MTRQRTGGVTALQGKVAVSALRLRVLLLQSRTIYQGRARTMRDTSHDNDEAQ